MKASQPSLRPGTKQVLLSFPNARAQPSGHVAMHSSGVYTAFLPLGLMFWGATEETFVRSVRVGNQVHVDLSTQEGRIPARYFQAGKTFSELLALADVGELQGAVEARQVLKMTQANAGSLVGVQVEGPFESFCMWGLTRDGEPPLLVRIARQTKQGPLRPEEPSLDNWLGELIARELEGDRVEFECEGPTPEVVSGLVASFMAQHKRPSGY